MPMPALRVAVASRTLAVRLSDRFLVKMTARRATGGFASLEGRAPCSVVNTRLRTRFRAAARSTLSPPYDRRTKAGLTSLVRVKLFKKNSTCVTHKPYKNLYSPSMIDKYNNYTLITYIYYTLDNQLCHISCLFLQANCF